MSAGTSRLYYEEPVAIAGHEARLAFSSAGRELKADAIRETIVIAARGSERSDSPLQQEIASAFARARQAGQANPLVFGAIPFDVDEPSCLHVPESYRWEDMASPTLAEVSLPALVAQKAVPDEAGFKRCVELAVANFKLSDVRKAVLSTTRELEFADAVDVEQILARLGAQNSSGYRFRVPMADGGTLVGISPELLLRKQGASVVSNPLAGSARRLADPAADRANADQLAASEKDHYEHSLVIEDIRDRLSPHCVALDVPEKPSLISTAALWHLSTRIEGTAADARQNALQLASVLHPTPAVCGFPTERARRLIRFVEPFERGLFTGMVGWMDAQGNGEWVVTIRCGTVHENRVRLFAGAGIVEASDPQAEWNEVQTKLGTMLKAFGLGD
ncbi:isochorismate synthase [Allorhizobium undicola]|uniref:isochorismate synthase n=1 Tax=Allorhizobium undicola TaxID=78527 RepID=UPI003D352DF8